MEKPDSQEVLQQVPVSAIMEKSYLSLPSTTHLHEAGWEMVKEKCHAALVMDEGDRIVGIITLRDLRRKLLEIEADSAGALIVDPEINQVCTTDILYAYESQPVAEALKQMTNRGLHLLPVMAVDQPHRIVGVLERHRIPLAGDLAETEAVLRRRNVF